MTASANLGRALREARLLRGLQQGEVGRMGHLDHSTISQIEHGGRRLPRDVGRRLAEDLDDGRLAIALAEDATAGAESPWLDGPAADLSRCATWAKAVEELQEATAAGQEALRSVLRAPGSATEQDRRQIRAALLEIIEAITAGRHVAAVACREYRISYRGLWQEHRRELRSKGYISA